MTDRCHQVPGEHGPTHIRFREPTRRERLTAAIRVLFRRLRPTRKRP